jgi:hypothetical protein
MSRDSIIEEIHAIREMIARESDYDLRKIVEAAKIRQSKSGRNAVQLPPRKAKLIRKVS